MARSLPDIALDPKNIEPRFDALWEAWLAGMCLGNVGMAIHHKLRHTLASELQIVHARIDMVLLPHTIAYNYAKERSAMGRVERAMGVNNAASGRYDPIGRLGGTGALKILGMHRSGKKRVAESALIDQYWNPRPLEVGAIRELLSRAFCGFSPLTAEAGIA